MHTPPDQLFLHPIKRFFARSHYQLEAIIIALLILAILFREGHLDEGRLFVSALTKNFAATLSQGILI